MKKLACRLAVLAMFGVIVGCAITDYDGWALHNTQAEAKLWGKDIAFTGYGFPYDGTYAYTVKYSNTQPQHSVTINSYQNPVISSFSRDGMIDRDGDDIQGQPGELGGKFLPFFIAVDTVAGTDSSACGFFANMTFDKSKAGPLEGLCFYNGGAEEIDKDTFSDLFAAFRNFDDLFRGIWTGQTAPRFSIDMNGLRLNGVNYWVTTFPIEIQQNGNRPRSMLISNSTGMQQVFQTILNNTQDGVPVNQGFTAAGGLYYDLPHNVISVFNHPAIQDMISPSGSRTNISPNLI